MADGAAIDRSSLRDWSPEICIYDTSKLSGTKYKPLLLARPNDSEAVTVAIFVEGG